MSEYKCLRAIIGKITSRLFCQLFGVLLVCLFMAGTGAGRALKQELTKAQAIARVRTVLLNNASGCRLRTRSISAMRVGAGWRVTARVVMSVSGSPVNETAIWIVSRRNGAVAQNQLTAEIGSGCP